MRTLTLLPSIMKRVDETLLVLEFNAMYFNNEIDGSALQAAISAPSAGLEVDYERLELLGIWFPKYLKRVLIHSSGDAYLKYLSSIYLFVTNPTMHEGMLHIARQKIISNKSLLVNSDKSGLPQYIQSKPFIAKMWLPLGYKVIKPLGKGGDVAEEEDDEKVKEGSAEVENNREQAKEATTTREECSQLLTVTNGGGARTEQKDQEAELEAGEIMDADGEAPMDVDAPLGDGVVGASASEGPKTIKKEEVEKPFKTVGNVKVVKKPKRVWLDDDHQWLGDKVLQYFSIP
jgi:endoribonuclease Dicer